MQDYEKLGVFYLGREYDAASKAPSEDLLLYDSPDASPDVVGAHCPCTSINGRLNSFQRVHILKRWLYSA